MSNTFVPKPARPAPTSTVGAIGWMRSNLFNSPINSVLTLFVLFLLYLYIPPILDWVFFSATLNAETSEECKMDTGACWAYIKVWWNYFMYLRYPDELQWRIDSMYIIAIIAGVPLLLPQVPRKVKMILGVFLLVPFPVICFFMFTGGSFGLEPVETNLWGGMFLTLVIAITGIVASLPIGILLALGRRSQMPAVRSVCVVFIEFWRGIPLITVLFMSSVMLPLFLPEGVTFDKLLRALIGVALFSSAYMAEVIRGGLQAIPKGQYEAASALGLNFWKSMGLIILPQALKIVIPGIVNTFIGLFKDTTLVLIIGMFDLLGAVQSSFTNPDWKDHPHEGYVFAAFAFWIFCFGMSRYSVALEKKLHTGHKR
jgi:general L-amino acid transport system permease protein